MFESTIQQNTTNTVNNSIQMEQTPNSTASTYQQPGFSSYPAYSTNYYDQSQYTYPGFMHSSNFNPYYNKSQSQYPFYPAYDQMQYSNSYYGNEASQTNDQSKSFATSVSPPPIQQTTSNKQTELTPEKVANDSGIDLISPQLNMVRDSMCFSSFPMQSSPTQVVDYSQQHQQLQQTRPQMPLQNSEANIEHLDKSNEMTNQINDNSSEYSDDEEEEDEEEDKENSKSKSNKNNSNSNNPKKPPKPYLEIIADAILTSEVKMMQLHEIYHLMEKKYQYFAKNVNKSWRNSVRHNLSLNECFVKAGRGSNGKGNYWKIHPLCEKEFIRGNFRRKSFKQLIRAGSQSQLPSTQMLQHIPYPVSIDYALNYRTQMAQQFPASAASSFNYNFLNSTPSAQSYNDSQFTEQSKNYTNYNYSFHN